MPFSFVAFKKVIELWVAMINCSPFWILLGSQFWLLAISADSAPASAMPAGGEMLLLSGVKVLLLSDNYGKSCTKMNATLGDFETAAGVAAKQFDAEFVGFNMLLIFYQCQR